jgi:acetyl esterase/lipase/outer membrane protein assembly factor BamB
MGDKRPCPFAHLAARGYAVASVNYRLSQHAVFPAQIEDAKAAVRWLRSRAAEHGLDPERFAASGHSAGGHLAALLGTSGGVKDLEGPGGDGALSSRIQCVADFFGPTDFLAMNQQAGTLSGLDHDAPGSPESQLIGGPIQENVEKAKRANPITYVSPDDPPFLILHGDRDRLVPVGQSRILHEALVKAGVDSTLHVVEGAGHGDLRDPAIPAKLEAFFEKHLRGPPRSASPTAGHWPAWRGPAGDGVSPDGKLPAAWSPTKNVKWRAPLPEPGNSTPIVWGDRVFITQPLTAEGLRAVLCFDRKDGRLLWKSGLPSSEKEPTHETNPYCSPSPATDGERVIAWLGAPGIAAFDLEGKLLWRRDLGKPDHVFGIGASPVIHGDLSYLNFGPGSREFLVALKKATGDVAWVSGPGGEALPGIPEKGVDRGDRDINGTWSTPIVVRDGGRDLVVCCFRDLVTAQDARTGELVWKASGMGPQTKASPVAGEGVVVALGGKDSTTMAVKLGGSGDVTATHVLWTEPRADSRLGTGVISGGFFFANHRSGIIECRELATGKVIWKERHAGPEGASDTWSSLFLAGGLIYAPNQGGDTFVVRAAPKYELVATNSLGERTNSSIAGSRGEIFIRTHAALWCIGE